MFFRKATDSASERRTSGRGAGSSEAQLKELRNKARRRLIGALALVLAAVIIVPPLFDAPPPAEPREPIVVPATSSGLVDTGQDQAADTQAADAGQAAAGEGEGGSGTDAASGPASAGPAASGQSQEGRSIQVDQIGGQAAQDGRQGQAGPAAGTASGAEKPAEAPQRAPAEPSSEARTPAQPPKPGTIRERTDDGSVALALLAGKMPEETGKPPRPASPSKAQGNFILQVAAYTTEQDARQRRDSLVESGVTNAYVERGQSGDKTVYRLRVGPFPTHEAAQAAQTRLRALGYQNGLISGK